MKYGTIVTAALIVVVAQVSHAQVEAGTDSGTHPESSIGEVVVDIDGSSIGRAMQVEIAKQIVETFGSEGARGVLAAWPGWDLDRLVRSIPNVDGPLTSFGTDVAVSAAEAAIVGEAADLATEMLFSSPPMTNIDPVLDGPLRAAVRAGIVELYDLQKAGRDPTALLGKVLDRAHDAVEIYQATALLAQVERRALVATALNVASAAEIGVAISGARGDALIAGARRDIAASTRGAVGRDDAEVVEAIFTRALEALVAHHRGRPVAAAAAYRLAVAGVRRAGNVNPFSAILNPIDWGVAAMNWGKDSPAVALEILSTTTAFGELRPGPVSTAPPPILYSSLAEGQAYGAYRARFTTDQLRRIADIAYQPSNVVASRLATTLALGAGLQGVDVPGWLRPVYEATALAGLRDEVDGALVRAAAAATLYGFGDQAGLTMDDLRLLSDARNVHQIAQHSTIPELADVAGKSGWTLLPPEKSAFHASGYASSDIRKYVHINGCEYVFARTGADWAFVNDGINSGTFNYASDEDFIAHAILDVLPWIVWGVGEEERSTVADRVALSGLAAKSFARARIADLAPGTRHRPAPVAGPAATASGCPGVAGYGKAPTTAMTPAVGVVATSADGSGDVNTQFIRAFSAYLAAAAKPEAERRAIYDAIAATFARIVADHPTSSQALAIQGRNVPGIDFAMLEASIETQNEDIAAPIVPVNRSWTDKIVLNTDKKYDSCLADVSFECLQMLDADPETIRFVRARESEGGEGPVVPTHFQELGRVDIAELGYFNAAGTTFPYFVNTAPVSISAAPGLERSLDVLAASGTPGAAALSRRYPEASAFYQFIGGMRNTTGGGQRFSIVIPWTEGCRACPIIGYNVASIDFDRDGHAGNYVHYGILSSYAERSAQGQLVYRVDDLKQDFSLVQYLLNLRGYDAGPMDGDAGRQSQRAIVEFQIEHGLEQTANALTDATLDALLDTETFFSNGSDRGDMAATLEDSGLTEPRRDDPVRSAILDAVRPLAEATFGAPVEFNGVEMRVNGPLAYADVFSQRPGGRAIDPRSTPDPTRIGDYSNGFDWNKISVLLRRDGAGTWRIERDVIAASEAFWLDDCATWGPLFPETCGSAEVGAAALAAPPGSRWLQTHSRAERAEAVAIAIAMRERMTDAQVFWTSNGWYAVVARAVADAEAAQLARIVRDGGLPPDAMLVKGETYVEAVPLPPVPATAEALIADSDWPVKRTFDSFSNQGIVFRMTVSAMRADGGVRVRLDAIEGRQVSGASFNAVEDDARFGLAFYVAAGKACKDCRASFTETTANGISLTPDGLTYDTPGLEVFVPDAVLAEAGEISVALAGNGLVFLLPDSSIPISALTVPSAGPATDLPRVTSQLLTDRLRLADTSAVEVAALMRAMGISVDGGFLMDVASETKAEALAAAYRLAPPTIETPDLPVATYGHDPATGLMGLCIKYRVGFSAKTFDEETWGPQEAALQVALPYATAFGTLPKICSLSNLRAIGEFESLHGTGQLERFDAMRGNDVSIVMQADPASAERVVAASAQGTLRASLVCDLPSDMQGAMRAMPFGSQGSGACEMSEMSLAILNPDTGAVERLPFYRHGRDIVAEGGFVTEAPPVAAPAAADVATDGLPAGRAPQSFRTAETGEAAIRRIVSDLVGEPAEVTLGYRNAFPFQSEPSKVLAIAVFGALPEDEIATVAGTEAGYGSFALKSWSDLNALYFPDDPEPGIASAIIGRIEDIRILSLQEVVGSACEWSVTYRIWLSDPTAFGDALATVSKADGHTFTACFRTTRDGYDVVSLDHAD